ncbi:MAG: 50S ribosomal protein L10 [Verrucomicrobiae bacterium]|nr:50S ribosomal protein L10 [Verrucomicrobiae bacterium]MCP5538868.1 50S ribosomal protein L10 [Akkermansiaceae bacterium]MCP5549628.1 50S ribosomal protein L10 [Akkermansiaceae bacterium]
MKAEKQIIIDAILERINQSPFMLVTDYAGMKVTQFTELRKRLKAVGAAFQVSKNTLIKRAADSASLPGQIHEDLSGQTAIVTGESDVCAAAKILKTFQKETGKPASRGGVLDGAYLSAAQVEALADLPSKEILQAQFLGVLQTPARQLVTVLNEPGASLARVLQAKADQG